MAAFRTALPEDTGLILQFIRALADYEGMPEQVVATEELLRRQLFERKNAEVLFVPEGER